MLEEYKKWLEKARVSKPKTLKELYPQPNLPMCPEVSTYKKEQTPSLKVKMDPDSSKKTPIASAIGVYATVHRIDEGNSYGLMLHLDGMNGVVREVIIDRSELARGVFR
jgi:hypothetical protein